MKSILEICLKIHPDIFRGGLIGKGILWMCKRIFSNQYYKIVFRVITCSFSCLFLFCATCICFLDWDVLI
ncbi:DNA-binding protein [Bacillus cytotoxicus]|nr:DNA-binding protein [Bacillus cytotoxicus]AWC33622.1 DNA-binding protein [Bacillus cytotoxicus]AWC37599.1 DNA-binding protein [Bacillus cytotoxicus]AWC41747.1 DNA-binding protein [Bacillus cytotoxicus]AWC45591.1 DNA-binding protein [Bacillus cytotoxicus]